MIGLLGKKIGMTQIFDEQGQQVPVTVLQVGPCYVTEVKNKEKHGYQAVQLAFDPIREKLVSKAKLGILKQAKAPALRRMGEIRTTEVAGLEVGQQVGAGNFQVGDFVDVKGTSIGRGFQGVVKRHNFKGALTMSHGDMSGRRPGSIGASSFPSRVVKGMKGPGHMGNVVKTTQNLKVVRVDETNNLICVHGTVPGAENGYLVVRTSLKRGTKRPWKVAGGSASKQAKPAEKETAGNPESSEKS